MSKVQDTSKTVAWDWKAPVPWKEINKHLKRHGCKIVPINTGSDLFLVKITPIKK